MSKKDKKQTELTADGKLKSSRRGALKKLGVSSGLVIGSQQLPNEWARPILHSVMLPAHAQASGPAAIELNGRVIPERFDSARLPNIPTPTGNQVLRITPNAEFVSNGFSFSL